MVNMRWAVLVCSLFWSCAPSTLSDGSHGELRQALPMPMNLPYVGPPGSRLGSSLAPCSGSGFVAGAPGTGTAWHSPSGALPQAIGSGLGRAVGCLPPSGGGDSAMVAGGDAGMRVVVSGGWTSAYSLSPTLSISVSDVTGFPVLVGTSSAFLLYNRTTGTVVNAQTGTAAHVVQWFSGSTRFAVTTSIGSMVKLYDFNTSTNGFDFVTTIPNNALGFGRALAVGDVLPAPGEELIIGAEGAVFVYLNDGTGPVMRLSGNNASFGTSVSSSLTQFSIEGVLVGEPADDRVFQFVGDAGSVFMASPSPGESFGASVAANGGEFAIGAPDHLMGSGAVYTIVQPPLVRVGEVQECTVGQPCFSESCLQGECLGGVFCDLAAQIPACLMDQRCDQGICVSFDGGTVTRDAGTGINLDSGVIDPDLDAGRPDASVSFDAGRPDAGSIGPGDAGMDAGSTTDRDSGVDDRDGGGTPQKDAGSDQVDGGSEPMYFTTSGCSETGLLPMLALCLAMIRRRVSLSLR